jgi:hypothetical protein
MGDFYIPVFDVRMLRTIMHASFFYHISRMSLLIISYINKESPVIKF